MELVNHEKPFKNMVSVLFLSVEVFSESEINDEICELTMLKLRF